MVVEVVVAGMVAGIVAGIVAGMVVEVVVVHSSYKNSLTNELEPLVAISGNPLAISQHHHAVLAVLWLTFVRPIAIYV